MSRKRAIARRDERRRNRIRRVARYAVGNLAYVILGGAILLAAVAAIAAAQHIPPSAADSLSSARTNGDWIHLSSKSNRAIIAAARKSPLFNVNRSGNGDYLKDLSHLENPILVRALHRPGSIVMPDYYIIPIDDASGATVAAAELELNTSHTAIRVSAIVTYASPRPHGQMAHLSMATAIADVSQQHHIKMKRGATATLAYFPVDASLLETGKVVWKSGGISPTDPIWLIPGADGQDHVVGTDGRVYMVKDMPFMRQP